MKLSTSIQVKLKDFQQTVPQTVTFGMSQGSIF